jgi:CDP-diglyceride synthetase
MIVALALLAIAPVAAETVSWLGWLYRGGDLANGLRALLLLIAANSAPWLAGQVFGARGALPVDLGLTLADGQRLLGAHKTWRGIAAGVVASALAGVLTGLSWWLGAGVGALSLLGDMLSSACKRRLGRAPGSDVPILDQLPESLLPLALLAQPLGLDAATAATVMCAFALLNVLSTLIRQRTSAVWGTAAARSDQGAIPYPAHSGSGWPGGGA